MVAGGLITIGVWQVVQVVGMLALGYLAVRLYARLDERVENRRRKAIKVGQEFAKRGFTRIPRFFTAYGIGDYSGCGQEVTKFWDALDDGVDVFMQEFEPAFDAMLSEKLADKDKAAKLRAKVGAAEAVLTVAV